MPPKFRPRGAAWPTACQEGGPVAADQDQVIAYATGWRCRAQAPRQGRAPTPADFPGKTCPRCTDPAGTTFQTPGTANPSIHAGLRPLSPCPRCPRAQSAEVEIRVGAFTLSAVRPTVVPVLRVPKLSGGGYGPPADGTRPPTKPAGNLAGNSISTFGQSQHPCGFQGIL
jgi:hypothetical protein